MVKKSVAYILMLSLMIFALPNGDQIHGSESSSNFSAVSNIPDKIDPNAPGYFIENKGQWDPDILFVGDTDFGRIIFRQDQIQYELIQYEDRPGYQSHTVRLSYPESAPSSIKGMEPTSTLFNYYIGSDPGKWASQCEAFRQIKFKNLWEGIDLAYYFDRDGLKYDLTLAPDADASLLKIHIDGASLHLSNNSTQAHFQTPLGTLMDAPLYTYGKSSLQPYPVSFHVSSSSSLPSDYALVPSSDLMMSSPLALVSDTDSHSDLNFTRTTLTFKGIPPAPRMEAIVVDPLIRSTYVGGATYGSITTCIAVGKNDSIYVAGITFSPDLPKTSGGAQPGINLMEDGFIVHYSSDLSMMYQVTYLGGNEQDNLTTLSVRPEEGAIYVAGYTGSSDFPNAIGGAQPRKRARGMYYWDDYEYMEKDGFISKLSLDLKTLHQSTYLGGSKAGGIDGIALAKNGSVYVVGSTSSSDFPKTSSGAIASSKAEINGFISYLSPDLSSLHQSSYINQEPLHNGIKISNDGTVYTAGRDVVKYSSDLKSIIGSFPNFDFSIESFDIASDNSVFIAGTTKRSDLPKTGGSAQEKISGDHDGFITHVSSNLKDIIKSTYLGGYEGDSINALKVLNDSELIVAGSSYSKSISSFADRILNPKTTISANANLFIASVSVGLDKFNQISYLGESYPYRKHDLPVIEVQNPGLVYITCETQCKHIPGIIYGNSKKMPYTGSLYKNYPIANSFISRIYFPASDEIIVYLQIAIPDANLIKEGKKQTIRMDVAPQVIQERTMVPLRFVAEAFDTKVDWIANTKSIRLVKGDTMIVMQIDSRVVFINERKIIIDAPPVVRNARTLVPVRFIAENMGYNVEWFPYTKEIKVSYK